jgi:anti-anti-sigma factor
MATQWSEEISITELADEPALSDELTSLVDRIRETPADQTPHVVLNLARVTYVNSTNIAQLLHLRQALSAHGKRLRLCSVNQDVWSVLNITGLDRVFRFAPDPLTALAGLQLEESDGRGG